MLKLNIGCGNLPLEGFKNVDKSPTAQADEFYDITEGLKEADESCEQVNAGCVIEQIAPNDKFIFVMNECWRVLKPGGTMTGYVPTTEKQVLFLDPMDRRFFLPDTFKYLVKGENAYKQFGVNYGLKGWSQIFTSVNEHGILEFKLTK